MKIRFFALLFAANLIGFPTHSQATYQEKYRPQLHFTPQTGWMNDPNGLVYYAGEYHLFYQHYPDAILWGPMHWGHAVSKDLVHWEHLPIALYPDSLGYIFSGSAVVDWKNSSGFGTADHPPLIAIFTYHNMDWEKAGRTDYENQGIAYSLDKGRSWTKYSGNPVLLNPGSRDFRDPRVIWHEASKQWKMILSAHDRVKIYSSDDLKKWHYESEFGSESNIRGCVWECPDLFPITLKGSSKIKWVLLVNHNPGGPNGGSGTNYFVGNFDGHRFIPDSGESAFLDWGQDNYAGVTWSDLPKGDGRRIFIGWMTNCNYGQAVPTQPWRSAMTIPRELQLKEEHGKYRINTLPVKELSNLNIPQTTLLFEKSKIRDVITLNTKNIHLNQCNIDITLEWDGAAAESTGLILQNGSGEYLKIYYSIKDQQIKVDRSHTGNTKFLGKSSGIDQARYLAGKQIKFHLLIDAASVELFVDEGEIVLTELFFLTENFNQLKIFAEGGETMLRQGKITGLKRIWPNAKP